MDDGRGNKVQGLQKATERERWSKKPKVIEARIDQETGGREGEENNGDFRN